MDGRTPDRYITLFGQRNKVSVLLIASLSLRFGCRKYVKTARIDSRQHGRRTRMT